MVTALIYPRDALLKAAQEALAENEKYHDTIITYLMKSKPRLWWKGFHRVETREEAEEVWAASLFLGGYSGKAHTDALQSIVKFVEASNAVNFAISDYEHGILRDQLETKAP